MADAAELIRSSNLLGRLVAELQVFVERDGVPDLGEDDGGRDDQGRGEQRPVRCELVHEGRTVGVDGGRDGVAGRLDALVETAELELGVSGDGKGLGEG